MSESKVYTAEQVAAMLEEQRQRLTTIQNGKAVRIYVNSGTWTPKNGPNKGQEVPFRNIAIEGGFKPTSVSLSVAKAILENVDALKSAVAEFEKPAPEAPKPANTAPRIAAKQ